MFVPSLPTFHMASSFRLLSRALRPHPLLLTLAAVVLIGLLPLRGVAQPTSTSPEKAYADAVQLYEQRLFRKSQAAFASFRDDHPDHPAVPQALYLEARSALALDRERHAVRLFETLQSTYPAHPRAEEAQISLGQYFIDAGETTRGRRIMERIAREDPDSPNAPRAIYLLGAAEREDGNLDNAATYFERVLRRHPDSDIAPAAAYDLASTQVRLERFEEAAASFESLARQYPDSPYAQNLGTAVAEVYYELGLYDRVIEELRPQIDTLPPEERGRALFFLAESYNQRGDTENAIVFYRRIIDEPQNDAYLRPALYGMGWTHLNTDNPDQAADSFARVRTVATADEAQDTLSMKAAYYEAVAHARAGRSDRAAAGYRTVAETWPNGDLAAAATYERGVLEYRSEQYSAAAASFRQVVRQTPPEPLLGDAHYMLGNAYTALNDLDRALEAYDEAVQRDAAPDSVRREVQFQKAWTLYENGRFDEAGSAFLALARDGTGQRSRDALFWGGDCLYEQGDYVNAQRRFQQYLQQYPNGRHAAAARYALGWTHFRQRQYQPAASAFRTFLDAYREQDREIPYRQDARLRLADSYYALKQYDNAIAEYRRVDGQGVDYALYQTGEALSRADRNDEAIRTLRRLVDEYPDSPWRGEAQFRIGFIHFQSQDYAAAREAYQTLIRRQPSERLAARSQYGIGDTYYNAGEMQQAVDAYLVVLQDYPKSEFAPEAASSLQYALLASGDPDRAEQVIEDFARENPGSPMVDELRFRRAEATYQSGEVNRALQLFQRFIRTSSNDALLPEAYFYVGEIYANREEPNEARTYLQQLVDNYPNSSRRPEAALRLGDLSLEQNNPQSALEAYRVVAEDEDVNPELRAQALYGQSVALQDLGRRDEAEALLQRLIDANRGGPLLASARLGLGRLYATDGRTAQAEDLFRRVAENTDSETGAEALVRLGMLLQEQGQPREAIRELDRVSSLFPGYPEWVARSLLEQAAAYRQLGETGEATRIYDQVMSEYGGTPFAEEARTEKQAL